jgi:two-component system, LytTR family, response regulator
MTEHAPPIRVAIVDDEPLARERLRRLLDAQPDMRVVALCGDGDSAVSVIVHEQPDLVFLDVQMPGRDGFQVIEALLADGAGHMPQVVFVTAFNEHALRAFEARALDYLVKPFDDERFAESLARIRRRVRQERMEILGDRLRQLLGVAALPEDSHADTASPEGSDGRLERLVLRSGDRVHVVKSGTVDWIGADGVYARVHIGRSSYLIRTPMHELETRLDPRKFVRIHRSTIVNLERVKQVHEVDRGEYVVVLEDGARLKLSRSRRAQFEALLGEAL